MAFHWDDFVFDDTGQMLTQKGRPVDVSRKTLKCIVYLIEHRRRVTTHDELTRVLWGHTNVTHNQLSQVILSARRVLGDDGHEQRLIRTMPGIGYRWIGKIEETVPGVHESGAEQHAQVPDELSATAGYLKPSSDVGTHSHSESAETATLRAISEAPTPWGYMHVVIVAALLSFGAYGIFRYGATEATAASATIQSPLIAELDAALQRGEFDAVRAGLVALPLDVANSSDARLLEIELDLKRGHVERASQKIEIQLARPEANEPVLRARLMIVKSKISSKLGIPEETRLALAQETIDILKKLGDGAPPAVFGRALERRALVQFDMGELNGAQRDLGLAIQLLEQAGDEKAANDVLSNLARLWMRMGRLHSALSALEKISKYYRTTSNRISELYARNTMTRIQMELMRWDDALASSERSLQLLEEIPEVERRHRTLQLSAQALTATGRLRSAASQLEEATASTDRRKGFVISAFHLLESGDYQGAMREASNALNYPSPVDRNDILLDGQEGAALIWLTAAQASYAHSGKFPRMNQKLLETLKTPRTPLGRIARGRWLWSQGHTEDAERELRIAIKDSRRMSHFFRACLATEPLVDVLLLRNDVAGAESAIDALYRLDTVSMNRDFRFNMMRLRVAIAKHDTRAATEIRRVVIDLAGQRPLPQNLQLLYAEKRAP